MVMDGGERMVTSLVGGWRCKLRTSPLWLQYKKGKRQRVTWSVTKDLLSNQGEFWTLPYPIVPGMREGSRRLSEWQDVKASKEPYLSMFTLFPLLRWPEKHFLFGTINLYPKLALFNLWDYAYNITLSLAFQGEGFFGEWFQPSKSSLVCILHRNHCTFLCWDPANYFFSLSSLFWFFYLSTSMLFEACGLS